MNISNQTWDLMDSDEQIQVSNFLKLALDLPTEVLDELDGVLCDMLNRRE